MIFINVFLVLQEAGKFQVKTLCLVRVFMLYHHMADKEIKGPDSFCQNSSLVNTRVEPCQVNYA